MKLNGIAIENLKIVPEAMMYDCAAKFEPEESNKFKSCIDEGMIFRRAGLTPIYLCTKSFKELFVTSREKLRKQYH
jgi:hypothetical protein